MASKTEIGNQALARVGSRAIIDIDDNNNPEARILKNVFDQSVKEVSRMHVWNCLKARSSLAQVATAPAFGFSYQYTLPTDCVKLVTINGYAPGDTEKPFEIEGRNILTDEETADITYIRYTNDTGSYDDLFVSALVVYIAAKIAVPIRQDEGLAGTLLREFYEVTLPRARKVDGNETLRKRHDPASDSNWVNSRFNSTNG